MYGIRFCYQISYSSINFVSPETLPLSLSFFLPVLALSVHICNVLVEDGPDAAVLRSPVYGIATATSTGDKESQVSFVMASGAGLAHAVLYRVNSTA